MDHFLSSERSKCIFAIGIAAIGVGFIAKTVISYPSECTTEEIVSRLNPLLIAHSFEEKVKAGKNISRK